MRIRSLVYLGLFLLLFAGCSRQSPSTAAQQAAPTPAGVAGQQAAQTASGTVAETMDAASYTYLRVRTATGDVWVATAQVKLAVGDHVVVPLEMPVKDFRSPSLNRDFPLIYFASRVDRQGETPGSAAASQMPSPGTMMPSHGQMTGAPATEVVTTKISPAEGGVTVADVWARRAALAGRNVTVRGKVVKFNGGILDRNWIHIQDGTGDSKDGTHDLALTTQGVTKVGDIITATGKVTLNKDIGSGYKYAVIVEDATIVLK